MKEPPKQREIPFDDPGSDGSDGDLFPVDPTQKLIDQLNHVDWEEKIPEKIEDYPFPGPAFSEVLDGDRLRGQLKAIFDLMKDGSWRTLKGIENITGFPQASISACLRAFRRKSLGRQTLNRERVERDGQETGTFKYQLILNKKKHDINNANC